MAKIVSQLAKIIIDKKEYRPSTKLISHFLAKIVSQLANTILEKYYILKLKKTLKGVFVIPK